MYILHRCTTHIYVSARAISVQNRFVRVASVSYTSTFYDAYRVDVSFYFFFFSPRFVCYIVLCRCTVIRSNARETTWYAFGIRTVAVRRCPRVSRVLPRFRGSSENETRVRFSSERPYTHTPRRQLLRSEGTRTRSAPVRRRRTAAAGTSSVRTAVP